MAFSARRMKILEPYIRRRSHELIDQMLQKGGPVEFVTSLAHPLPGQIIFRFIGFPETDDDQLIDWTSNRLAFTWGKPSEEEQVDIAANMVRYWRYCREFVALRSSEPADDLTSELLADHRENPDDLSYREVESIIYGLSFAGHEIVSNFISNTLLSLLPNRDDWEAICKDPGLIPNMLEEVLRYDSPQTSWRRVTTRDTELAGIQLPAGTRIFHEHRCGQSRGRGIFAAIRLRYLPGKRQKAPVFWPGDSLLPGRPTGPAGGPDRFGGAGRAHSQPASGA